MPLWLFKDTCGLDVRHASLLVLGDCVEVVPRNDLLGRERHFFLDNLLVRIDELLLVDRPCAMVLVRIVEMILVDRPRAMKV